MVVEVALSRAIVHALTMPRYSSYRTGSERWQTLAQPQRKKATLVRGLSNSLQILSKKESGCAGSLYMLLRAQRPTGSVWPSATSAKNFQNGVRTT